MTLTKYQVTLTGKTPLLLHNDNRVFGENVRVWQKAVENQNITVAGDDRAPAWAWIGYTYHDESWLGINSDNLMTMLREGGTKVKLKGKETYKKLTQSSIIIDDFLWPIVAQGKMISWPEFAQLEDNLNFPEHVQFARDHGFDLFVKPARVGSVKHVRVRPRFDNWSLSGTISVLDEEITGLTQGILEEIFRAAGSFCGLCDWRPSSPRASGRFGTFTAEIERV